jgi:drug/metabolite transporter (DMT)-like permease
MHQRRRGRLFVALAAVAWSTAGLFQRELSVDVGAQLAGRALFAALGLLAYVGITERGRVLQAFRAIGRGGMAIVGLLAVSSASFLVALNHAPVANVLFMQALAPIIAAALGTLLGEPVSRRTWLAMAVALAGVAVMVGGPGSASWLGQGLSLLMAVSFAATLVITRHRREVSMAPATCLSQILVFAAAAPFAHVGGAGAKDATLLATLVITRHRREVSMAPATCLSQILVFAAAAPFAHVGGAGAKDATLLATLGIFQIGLGFVFLTIGGRLIPAGEVALITLLEIVLGPIWVWAILSEQPAAATLAGGAIVLAAVLLQAKSDGARPVTH